MTRPGHAEPIGDYKEQEPSLFSQAPAETNGSAPQMPQPSPLEAAADLSVHEQARLDSGVEDQRGVILANEGVLGRKRANKAAAKHGLDHMRHTFTTDSGPANRAREDGIQAAKDAERADAMRGPDSGENSQTA